MFADVREDRSTRRNCQLACSSFLGKPLEVGASALTKQPLDDALDNSPRINNDLFADVDDTAQQPNDRVKDVTQDRKDRFGEALDDGGRAGEEGLDGVGDACHVGGTS